MSGFIRKLLGLIPRSSSGSSKLLPLAFALLTFVLVTILWLFAAKGKDSFIVEQIGKWVLPSLPEFGLPPIQQEAIARAVKENAAALVFAFIAGFGALISYVFTTNAQLDAKLDQAAQNAAQHRKTIDEIKNSVTSPKFVETVKVGIFDNLLAYAPLYVAKAHGYFNDEMLDVQYSEAGGTDKLVADKVRSGEYHFGICDPIYCLEHKNQQHVTSSASSDTDLLVLLPMGKRLGATVMARLELNDHVKLDERKVLRIGSYKSPSTTYCIARWLKDWLTTRVPRGIQIEIVQIAGNDPSFSSRDALASRLIDLDFIVLWEPQTSWLLKIGYADEAEKFGIFSVSATGQLLPSGFAWEVMREKEILFSGPRGHQPPSIRANLKPWTPFNSRDKWYRHLASAVITTRYTVRTRPELCLRMFRSLSRALVRLENLDWGVEQSKEPDPRVSILRAIQVQTGAAEYVDLDVIKSLVGGFNRLDITPGRSLFPFIDGVTKYDPTRYHNHLKNTHELWDKVNQWETVMPIPNLPETFKNYESYRPFFIGRDQLNIRADHSHTS